MLTIDGSEGEGGGQVLRASLALSLVTGQPFRITGIRARRAKPGLLRQHLTAVQAAAAISSAAFAGAALGSRELTFSPGPVRGGAHTFSIETAGSTTLVLQAILPGLARADAPSELTLEGGTHNPSAPPFEFLRASLLPLLGRVGVGVEATLERYGFYPTGGGRLRVHVTPAAAPRRLDLLERGPVRACRALAVVARLPRSIAERETETLARALGWPPAALRVEETSASASPGNVVLAEVESEHVTALFTGFGERGLPAETVASRVAADVAAYLRSAVPVEAHLADQLLVPLALAAGGTYRTGALSGHTRTQAGLLRRFLGVEPRFTPLADGTFEVEVRPAG